MARNRRVILSLVAMLGLALGSWMVLSAGDSTAVQEPQTQDIVTVDAELSIGTAGLFSPVGKGKGPPSGGCCDPSLEPGVGGNPFCFEGHTCCSSGVWGCNNADGSPSCEPGEVCEGCSGSGASCTEDADCCSGKCKGNGICR